MMFHTSLHFFSAANATDIREELLCASTVPPAWKCTITLQHVFFNILIARAMRNAVRKRTQQAIWSCIGNALH